MGKNAQDVARDLFAKIENYANFRCIAVFVSEVGKVRTCGVNTDMFQIAMRQTPHRLAGVYNNQVLEEWIADDLRCLGMA